jgi:hypothetical protein
LQNQQLNFIALQYLKDLKDWSIPIKAVDEWVKAEKAKEASTKADKGKESSAAGTSSMSVVHAGQLVLPSNPTQETAGFYKQLVLLQSGKSHTDTSDLQKVYANLSYAAAAVGFSSNPLWWKIADVKSLKAQMAASVRPPPLFHFSLINIIPSDTMFKPRIQHFSRTSRRRSPSTTSSCRINWRFRFPRWSSCYRRKFMVARFAEMH